MRYGFLLFIFCLAFNCTAHAQVLDSTRMENTQAYDSTRLDTVSKYVNNKPEGRRISLQEAINIALKNNYQLKQASNNLTLAQKQILGAKADFLPSVSAQFSGRSTQGQQFNNTTLQLENRTRNSINGSISASLPIFQGFRNIVNLRRSNVNKEYQQASNLRTRQTVIFNAVSGFLQVVLNQQLLKISRQTLAYSKDQLKQVKGQVQVGSAPSVDQYNQESTVASNEVAVIQQENTLSYSKTQLLATLQLDPTKQYTFVAPDLGDLHPVPTSLNLQNLIQKALASRNDLKAQQLLIKRNRKDLGLARANYYPTISASAGISSGYYDTYSLPSENQGIRHVNFSDQFFNQQINKYVGININIPIFNHLTTRLNVQQSKINYQNSKLDYQNLKYSALEEVRQAYNDYRSYKKQLGSTKTAVKAAQKSYFTQRERYQVGAGSLVEYSNANSQYVQAQANRVQAVLRFIFQKKLLDYYLGKLNKNVSFRNQQ